MASNVGPSAPNRMETTASLLWCQRGEDGNPHSGALMIGIKFLPGCALSDLPFDIHDVDATGTGIPYQAALAP